MPHQCVRCNAIYEDASKELLKGCTSCGGRFFFFIKKEHLEKTQEVARTLTKKEKEVIERDVMDIVGIEDDKPVVLDLESINIAGPGKFELDLVRLFKGEPLVYRLEEGKYIIDVARTFKGVQKEKTQS